MEYEEISKRFSKCGHKTANDCFKEMPTLSVHLSVNSWRIIKLHSGGGGVTTRISNNLKFKFMAEFEILLCLLLGTWSWPCYLMTVSLTCLTCKGDFRTMKISITEGSKSSGIPFTNTETITQGTSTSGSLSICPQS